ncbi:MAG: non-canonical purine NTP pyrophosphatase [Phycisphaeraceae bacterium]
MKLLIATGNPHKVQEIRAVLAHGADRDGLPIEWLDLSHLERHVTEPVEDAATFEGNAVKKARHYAQATGMLCLADDSGLAVDALGGAPGVRSARYAGVDGPRSVVDPANNRLLLERLASVPIERRTARFVCAMALAGPGLAQPIIVCGTVEGRILLPQEAADPSQPHRGRGGNGFGYDPLFLIPELGKTTAELEPQHKNALSHRGKATRLMRQRLRAFLAPGHE